ncbi:MAG: SMODS domain-containing nucleotidyltransferase [Actinomycetota bacterium]
MSLATSFESFLSSIRPTAADMEKGRKRHTELRENLLADKPLAAMILHTFLQGSYRRSTILRPTNEEKMDVDLVVVTTIDERLGTGYAFDLFKPFVDRHYQGQWKLQGRSIGISLHDVDLDLVITARPPEPLAKSLATRDHAFAAFNKLATTPDNWVRRLTGDDDTVEDWFDAKVRTVPAHLRAGTRQQLAKVAMDSSEEWRKQPLRIPDREAREWQDTHPMAQIEWTRAKNAETNGHFVNIVKAVKCWKREVSGLSKYPKGYPLEHMVGDCCPNDVTTFGDGLRDTLDQMATKYRRFANAGTVPFLPDHGCADVNVLARLDGDDFQLFHRRIDEARETACRASDCNNDADAAGLWHSLLGASFPLPALPAAAMPPGGFSERTRQTEVSDGRFA